MPIGSATSKLTVVLSALDKTGAGFKSAEKGLAGLGNKASALGGKLTRSITLPLLGLGVAAGKMAMDFSDALAFSNTMMNESAEGMERMKKVALDLAAKTGKSSTDIVKGFYDVASAGFKGEEAFKIQEVAAKGATAGFIEHSQAVNALVKNLSIYGKTGDDAGQVMDVMQGIVDKGLLTFEQLSTSFARASAFAVPLNISMEEMGGAMAFMSKKTATAEEAASSLQALTRAFIKPSTKMIELTGEWADAQGMAKDTTTAQMVQILGLRGTMRLLGEATAGNTEKMGELIPEALGLNSALYLTSEEGMKELAENTDYLNDSLGLTEKKFEIASKSAKIQLARALEMLKGLAIEVGGVLLTELIPHIENVALKIKDLTTWFAGLGEEGQSAVLKLLGILLVIGPVMKVIGAIIKLITWIGKIGIAIGGPGAAAGVAAAFTAFATAAVIAIGSVVVAGKKLKEEWDNVNKSVVDGIRLDEEYMRKMKEMWEAGDLSAEEYRRRLLLVLEQQEAVSKAIGDTRKFFSFKAGAAQYGPVGLGMPKAAFDWLKGLIGFQEGGIVPGPVGKSVPAVVHGGEEIIPAGESAKNIFNFNFAGAIISNKEEFAQEIMRVVNRETKFSYLNYV